MSLKNMGKNTQRGHKGNVWEYTASDGSLHRLKNQGYYSGWQADMWASAWWCKPTVLLNGHTTAGGWAMGTIADSRAWLIARIEKEVKA